MTLKVVMNVFRLPTQDGKIIGGNLTGYYRKDGRMFINEEEKRKIYTITELGLEVLRLELKRIKRLYHTSQEVI